MTPAAVTTDLLNQVSYNAPVTLSLIIISFIVVLLDKPFKKKLTRTLFSTYRSPLTHPLTWVRMFTHILGHTDFNHFSGNATLLLLMGPVLESHYGSMGFLGMILITAFLCALVNAVFFPHTYMLGSSCIDFMVITMSAMLPMVKGTIPLTLILVVLLYGGREIWDGFTKDDNVAHYSHICGGVCGIVLALISGGTVG